MYLTIYKEKGQLLLQKGFANFYYLRDNKFKKVHKYSKIKYNS